MIYQYLINQLECSLDSNIFLNNFPLFFIFYPRFFLFMIGSTETVCRETSTTSERTCNRWNFYVRTEFIGGKRILKNLLTKIYAHICLYIFFLKKENRYFYFLFLKISILLILILFFPSFVKLNYFPKYFSILLVTYLFNLINFYFPSILYNFNWLLSHYVDWFWIAYSPNY